MKVLIGLFLMVVSVACWADAKSPVCTTEKNCIKKATKCMGGDAEGRAILRFATTVTCVDEALNKITYNSESTETLDGVDIPTGENCSAMLQAALAAWNMCQ